MLDDEQFMYRVNDEVMDEDRRRAFYDEEGNNGYEGKRKKPSSSVSELADYIIEVFEETKEHSSKPKQIIVEKSKKHKVNDIFNQCFEKMKD